MGGTETRRVLQLAQRKTNIFSCHVASWVCMVTVSDDFTGQKYTCHSDITDIVHKQIHASVQVK